MVASSTQRTLKRRGPIRLVETTNPIMGVTYTLWERSLGLWRGTDLMEAERQFDQAIPLGIVRRADSSGRALLPPADG